MSTILAECEPYPASRRNRWTIATLVVAAAWLLAGRAEAQQSANFRVDDGTLNEGGRPLQGVSLAGSVYRISLDSIGDSTAAPALGSASFRLDSGLIETFAPPGEVMNQRFTNASAMTWNPEKSVGVYEVYRGLLSGLPGGFGACFQSSLVGAAANDAASPPAGDGWFYLVTAKNRLGEEGTKGYQSSGTMRTNASPCP
jgi:hypothetical protein